MNMKPQELIKAIVAGVGELIKAENETLNTVLMTEIKSVKVEIKSVKTELGALREDNKKEHTEIMDKLTTSHETNGEELKKLDERVTEIEKELHIHKN